MAKYVENIQILFAMVDVLNPLICANKLKQKWIFQ